MYKILPTPYSSFFILFEVAGPKFEGAVVNLTYQLLMGGSLGGIKEAFFRTDLPNITSLVSTIVVFIVVIYFQGFRVDIPIKHTQVIKTQIIKRMKNLSILLFFSNNSKRWRNRTI